MYDLLFFLLTPYAQPPHSGASLYDLVKIMFLQNDFILYLFKRQDFNDYFAI